MESFRNEQLQAANAFDVATIDLLKSDRGVHAETAIAGVARMAGAFLLRSFGFKLDGMEPGAVVLS